MRQICGRRRQTRVGNGRSSLNPQSERRPENAVPPVTLVIVGAGARGAMYAAYALERPDRARVVAVADPNDANREALAAQHDIDTANCFSDWREVVSRGRIADAVVIATQDAHHAEPAIAFSDLGYAILLEKPMAPSIAECRAITDAVRRNGNVMSVCHTMRYVYFTRRIREMIEDGLIGDVMTVQHHHPVGWWHYAHGWVRGNWAVEADSSFMLLAKGCHDVDWLQHIVGSRCAAVSSFGSLQHFRPENQPAGASDRCLDCSVEPECPYSAVRIYGGWADKGETGWPVSVLARDPTSAHIRESLRDGPYGRCVYTLNNDVIDHQVLSLLYENGATATMTMSAFNKDGGMFTRIYGTRGEIFLHGGFGELRNGRWEMNEASLRRFDFVSEQWVEEDPFDAVDTQLHGHMNGDFHLVDHFITALLEDDESYILTGAEETLRSHETVFAAEESRLSGETVYLTPRRN